MPQSVRDNQSSLNCVAVFRKWAVTQNTAHSSTYSPLMPCVRPLSFLLVLIAEVQYNQGMRIEWEPEKAKQTGKVKHR